MDERQIDFVFSSCGYRYLYDYLKTPIEISGILDQVDSDVLESFLETLDFTQYDRLLFDEFRYYFSIFKIAYKQFI